MASGKGWKSEESFVACRAFISASADPPNGNVKKRELFVAQIGEAYLQFIVNVLEKNVRFVYSDCSASRSWISR